MRSFLLLCALFLMSSVAMNAQSTLTLDFYNNQLTFEYEPQLSLGDLGSMATQLVPKSSLNMDLFIIPSKKEMLIPHNDLLAYKNLAQLDMNQVLRTGYFDFNWESDIETNYRTTNPALYESVRNTVFSFSAGGGAAFCPVGL